ncbi:MAG: hypothetical protein WC506_03840 [Candidatus Micrarchaeia archaeon]
MEKPESSPKTAKGQAAMEYLVTYGWTLLVLVVIIAILIATGIFSPANFQPEECNFQPDFPCMNYIAYNNAAGQTSLLFNASNGFGFPILIENISARTAQGNYVSGAVAPAYNTILRQGDTVSSNITMPGQSSSGKLESFYVTVTFRNCYLNDTVAGCQSQPQHNITGRLTTRINQG